MESRYVYLNPRQVLAIYLSQEGECLYCEQSLTPENLTVEHVICRFWGGPSDALWNLALACESCNSLKGALEGGIAEGLDKIRISKMERIQRAMQLMHTEARGVPVVQRMLVEIKRRLNALQSYIHEHLPEGEARYGSPHTQGRGRARDGL